MTYNENASEIQCRKFSYSTVAAIFTKSLDVNFLVQISCDHSFAKRNHLLFESMETSWVLVGGLEEIW